MPIQRQRIINGILNGAELHSGVGIHHTTIAGFQHHIIAIAAGVVNNEELTANSYRVGCKLSNDG